MPVQDKATFFQTLDYLDNPFSMTIVPELMKQSKLLGKIIGKDLQKVNGEFKLGKTTTGRTARVAINKYLPFENEAALNDLNIQFGDTKQGVQGRDLIYAQFTPVDMGTTITMTKADMQEIQGYSKGDGRLVDWLKDSWMKAYSSMGLNMIYGILKGTGTAVRSDGQTRNTFVGLPTIVGSASYGGKAATDFKFWKGWDWDCDDGIFGYAAAAIDSISELLTVSTSTKLNPFFDIMNKARGSLKSAIGGNPNLIAIMHPVTYDALFQPTVNALQIPQYSGFQGKELGYATEEGQIYGMPVIREDAHVNGVYMCEVDKIYILNLDDIVLEAEKSENFVTSDWIWQPTQYGVANKSITSTLFFYAKKRFGMGVITLAPEVKVELEALLDTTQGFVNVDQ